MKKKLLSIGVAALVLAASLGLAKANAADRNDFNRFNNYNRGRVFNNTDFNYHRLYDREDFNRLHLRYNDFRLFHNFNRDDLYRYWLMNRGIGDWNNLYRFWNLNRYNFQRIIILPDRGDFFNHYGVFNHFR